MPEIKTNIQAMKQGVSNQQSWASSETNNLDQYSMEIHIKTQKCLFATKFEPPERDRKKIIPTGPYRALQYYSTNQMVVSCGSLLSSPCATTAWLVVHFSSCPVPAPQIKHSVLSHPRSNAELERCPSSYISSCMAELYYLWTRQEWIKMGCNQNVLPVGPESFLYSFPSPTFQHSKTMKG